MRTFNRLSPTRVRTLRKQGRYGDGRGLWLQISKGGTKAWLFRFMINGRARQMGLGPIHTISLWQARILARRARQLLVQGIDPIAERNEMKARQIWRP